MKKCVYIILLLLMIILLYIPFYNVDADVVWSDVETTCVDMVNRKEFEKWNDKIIKKYYKLSKDDYKKALVLKHSSPTEAQEIAVFYQEDKNKRKNIRRMLEDRKQAQYNIFKGYDMKQCECIKKSSIFEKGDYVFLIIHKNVSEIEQKLKSLF